MSGKTALVTGASGFIGREVCARLLAQGVSVRAATSDAAKRDALYRALQDDPDRAERSAADAPAVEVVTVPAPLHAAASWEAACEGVDAIIHLAGRAHILKETEADPLTAFRTANRDTSVALARAASAAGVRRMVFVSSIGVNGSGSGERPISESDPPRPHDAYSRSKLEAETALLDIAAEGALEVVVVRPPLVYGGGARGNFARLIKLVDLGLPVPLGAVRNARSLIGVENLADALATCAFHERAAGQVFLAADGVDMSTPELFRHIAAALGRPVRLIPVPVVLLKLAGRLTGQSRALDRLCGSLQVDSGKLRATLGWSPPLAPEQGLRKAVSWYRRHRHDRR